MIKKIKQHSVVMMGASGAVGSQALKTLLNQKGIKKITSLGRREIPYIKAKNIKQFKVNIEQRSSYEKYLQGCSVAICTLGVGQPTKFSKEHFIKIDKIAVLNFAKACKKAEVKHFQLLASIGINAKSAIYYFRCKGELVEELKALNFSRLSIFEPSTILTPTNRYGFSQAIALKVWPWLSYVLLGGLKKYRGIKVDVLGAAMAKNIFLNGSGYEVLRWENFISINNSS